ncbi:hypothetical protein BHM03_00054653 [Ensete ventricosum]|nr:hypothetical protein BHM03_00054653 [Ensete ventricosum]
MGPMHIPLTRLFSVSLSWVTGTFGAYHCNKESLQRRFFLPKPSHSYSASNEAAVGRRPARPSASGRGRNPFSCGRMMTLRLGSSACSALPSGDRCPLSSYVHSAPLRALASCGGGEAVLGFSFRSNKWSPMTLDSPSRSAQAARFVAASQDHGGGSSSERVLMNGLLFSGCYRHDGLAKRGVSNTVVGVLGGGQLGRMLCQAASQMAVKVVILDPLESCPASGLAYQHVVGSFDDGDAVREFAKRYHLEFAILSSIFDLFIGRRASLSSLFDWQLGAIDNLANTEKAGELFGYPLMIKSKRLAYDGRGNAVAHTKEELPSVVAGKGS